MADGKMRINPAEARNKAIRMRTVATNLENLLNNVSREFNKINDVDEGIYQGNKNPAALRAELDSIKNLFHLTYEQILKSADDIITTANTMEAE